MGTLQETPDLFIEPAFLQLITGAVIVEARGLINLGSATDDESKWARKALNMPLQMAERMRGSVAVALTSITPNDAQIKAAVAGSVGRFAKVDLPDPQV